MALTLTVANKGTVTATASAALSRDLCSESTLCSETRLVSDFSGLSTSAAGSLTLVAS